MSCLRKESLSPPCVICLLLGFYKRLDPDFQSSGDSCCFFEKTLTALLELSNFFESFDTLVAVV
jgi:hypothetical protein